jgi:DNA (cytosine-5)-methyltransferase 1
MRRSFTAIDLFCGAGGLSEGFRQSGFSILAGNDFDDSAGVTFSTTHAEATFLGGSVKNISAGDFLHAAGLKKGQLDCLIGGPPCQAFSVYNHQRGMHDDRSQLFKEYLRLVEGLQPNWVVLENVTGILSAGNGAAFHAINLGLQELGYDVRTKILKAEEYGIPQERRRVVFLANRVGMPIIWPEQSHGQGKTPFVTIRDAISDLPILVNGENSDAAQHSAEPNCEYQREMRIGSNFVLNHSAPKLSQANLERMKHIPPGGSWRDIPFELLPEGMKRAKRSDHTKRYGRMAWDAQSCTILTKCDVHWGAYIHPEADRAITVREAARLQSFPDWFEFKGSRTEQYVQVGNAVPPRLGRCLGESIIKSHSAINRDIDAWIEPPSLVAAE